MVKRRFTKEFKLQVLREVAAGKEAVEIARQYELKHDLIYRWRKEYNADPTLAFSGRGVPSREATKVAELERKIGQLYLENEFLKKAANTLQAKLAEIKRGV